MARRWWGPLIAAAFATPTLPAQPIERSAKAVRAFRATNPRPGTGLTRGACPGWHIDHVQPLCAGGTDSPDNMQWLSHDDHRFKTLVDRRECAKLRKSATEPAKSQNIQN